MIKDLFFYYFIFAISIAAVALLQHYSPRIILSFGLNKKTVYESRKAYIIFLVLAMLPLILIYGLRYGIGTDYFNYEHVYDILSNSTLIEYIKYHSTDSGSYYVEPAYYILNVISPSFRAMQFLIAFIIFVGIAYILRDNKEHIIVPFSLWIYLCTQFVYAMNGVRFSIAIVFILFAYNSLLKGKSLQFLTYIVIACTFHKTAFACLALYFLKDYKTKLIKYVQNLILVLTVLLFPIINPYILLLLNKIPMFSRLFASYSIGHIYISFRWMIHIIPVIVPMVIFTKDKIKNSRELRFMFRIYLMEIPFRMMGLYNTWFARLSRFPQIIEVLLIPQIIGEIKNPYTRRSLYIYYSIWYLFYFGYYAIVNDRGDSLPYVSWILK